MAPILSDPKASLDVIAFTAIALGLIYVGSCNEEVAQAIIFTLMDRSESELGEPLTRLLPLGLGLLYLGKQVFLFWQFHLPLLLSFQLIKKGNMVLQNSHHSRSGVGLDHYRFILDSLILHMQCIHNLISLIFENIECLGEVLLRLRKSYSSVVFTLHIVLCNNRKVWRQLPKFQRLLMKKSESTVT